MTERIEVEVLGQFVNNDIVQLPFRSFPGVVIPGDSLRILCDEVQEASGLLKNGDVTEAIEIIDGVVEQLNGRLSLYEKAVQEAG